MDRQMNKQADRQMDKRTDGQMDRWTDGQNEANAIPPQKINFWQR